MSQWNDDFVQGRHINIEGDWVNINPPTTPPNQNQKQSAPNYNAHIGGDYIYGNVVNFGGQPGNAWGEPSPSPEPETTIDVEATPVSDGDSDGSWLGSLWS